jgi:hypothetical protein
VASVNITRRHTSSGPRYVVRYRLGGRAYPIVHGGSFPREREAKTRRDLIAGELAAGRNPADVLRALEQDRETHWLGPPFRVAGRVPGRAPLPPLERVVGRRLWV